MQTRNKIERILLCGLLIFLWIGIQPAPATAADCNCSADAGEPPFLSRGPDPNVLLIIDNSESMYDVGYRDLSTAAMVSRECFDDSFATTASYTGYFDQSAWYTYNATDTRFEVVATPPSGAQDGGIFYSSVDVKIEVKGDAATGWTVIFHATGKFLNWATASRFDIEKSILTGGKYDSVNQQLISEGRGCAGYRFVKETSVTNSSGTYELAMGIISSDSDETTQLEIFRITTEGYNEEACDQAIQEVINPTTGNPQQEVVECIDPENKADSEKQVLIHSTTDCWKAWKGDLTNWPQHTVPLLEECMDVYNTGIEPAEITPSSAAYACTEAYIGSCWNSGATCNPVLCVNKPANDAKTIYQCDGTTGLVEFCAKNRLKNGVCLDGWTPYVECEESATADSWIDGYDGTGVISDALNDCFYDAMLAYCGALQLPQVVDPSDFQQQTDEFTNIPAILVDGGLLGTLGEPMVRYPVRVKKADTAPEPRGVIQEFAPRVRIGAMAFNTRGSAEECAMIAADAESNPHVLYACEETGNLDGAKVIWPISSDGETADHTMGLVSAINAIKANTWTPLAEAMYTAIGYYTQNDSIRFNMDDFTIGPAPITSYCQSNNVMFITDGASTADLRSELDTMTDGDTGDGACGTLYGSSYLDDLTFHARQAVDLYGGSSYTFIEPPKNINTYAVFTDAIDESSAADECTPYGLMHNAVLNGGPTATSTASDAVFEGNDPETLNLALHNAFKDLLKRASAGSAASVISATRSGEGAVYQAIFWPGIEGPLVGGVQKPDVTWAGEVHSLLVDSHGMLFEDTNGDKKLTDLDERVVFFFDENGYPAETKACYGVIDETGVCSGTVKTLHEVKYLWSAAEWLAGISGTDIVSNRTTYISNEMKRYIFTWNDLNNNGIVEKDSGASEILAFDSSTDWDSLTTASNRRAVPNDFGMTTNAQVNSVVNWMRGLDGPGQRSREVVKPPNFSVTASADDTIYWRLGDVIYSTPTVVARPAESFHLLYQDVGYIDFVEKYKDRRQVVYFGGNDGMLHAINGGFYNAAESTYCTTAECADNPNAPALGAELWAYVPYNLHPQLKCLPQPNYLHRYYVDLKPRIFDVQIFPIDADHPQGWGTILVAGMRLGGNTVEAGGTAPDSNPDSRKFTSAYVILDITNPENPPVLLGELTPDPTDPVHMGYTTAVPTVVPMKDGTGTKWYLILGSGPQVLDAGGNWVADAALPGRSNQPSKVAVFPLEELTKSSPGAFRIPNQAPASDNNSGRWVLADNGFVSDLITVDFQQDQNYRGDVVYFGTVEGDYGDWRGKMYRIVTDADSGSTTPFEWDAPSVLFNPVRPITAAASIGWDGDNYWVYFGTGRFFDKDDKSDASSNAREYYFGIKEPVSCSSSVASFSWAEVLWTGTDPLRVDQIQVQESLLPDTAGLVCVDGSDNCRPSGVDSLGQLIGYIAGQGCASDLPTGISGWYQELPGDGERNLGQATLLGGLVTFTTYQPFNDICKPDGLSFLSAVHYQTGTASWQTSFSGPYSTTEDDPPTVVSRIEIGHGLASTPNLHVGREEGAKAFVQTSTGAIIEIEEPNLPISGVKSGRVTWRND